MSTATQTFAYLIGQTIYVPSLGIEGAINAYYVSASGTQYSVRWKSNDGQVRSMYFSLFELSASPPVDVSTHDAETPARQPEEQRA